MANAPKIEYAKLTWPEVAEAVQRDPVVLIPTGAIEQHGPMLPLDTDILISGTICRRVAERVGPHNALLMPPLWFGYESHHMAWPGTIDIGWELFVKYALCVTRSLAHHGFRRILLVNGHGSNRPLIDLVARLTTVENNHVLAAALSWFELEDVRAAFDRVRTSEWTSHACELETSAYLYLAPEFVQMDRAVRDMTHRTTPHTWTDLTGRKPDPAFKRPVAMMEIFSTNSSTGVRGDATAASAEKGRVAVEAAIEEIAQIVLELKERTILPPRDFHGPDGLERALAALRASGGTDR